MSRRYGASEVTFDERRDREYSSRNGSRYDDRYSDQEIKFRRSAPPVKEREREEIDIREERSSRGGPAFLREDYGRTSAGPVVLRAREREDFEFIERPRRRSPSVDRKEKESIVIRRGESRGPPPRERSRDREEIIIRRDERERSRPPPPPPPEEREREEIIIRRDERSRSRPPARDDRETERIIIRRKEDDDDRRVRYEPPPREWDREEIIIRRDDDERSYAPRRNEYVSRPKSRERERSTIRGDERESEEIVIRRDEKDKRGRSSNREREREEIIITRDRSFSRSPSPAPSAAPSVRPQPPPEPQIVYAPQIHQEIVTHHRHVDHGYEIDLPPRPRAISRPPTPPSPPPPPRERSEERIEIRRTGERNGRSYDDEIVIDRNERSRSVPPPIARREERFEREEEEIDFYDRRQVEKTSAGGDIGRRYGKTPDPKAGLWTEVTKDLVVKEAIQEMGYEYEETDEFYYIIAYLKYEDVARLVGLSEDIRKDRRKRVKEIEWESRLEPEEPPRRRLAIEGPPIGRSSRSGWEEDDRYFEREIIYRGGRPPPPPGWRR